MIFLEIIIFLKENGHIELIEKLFKLIFYIIGHGTKYTTLLKMNKLHLHHCKLCNCKIPVPYLHKILCS